jgi:hypothetical protein
MTKHNNLPLFTEEYVNQINSLKELLQSYYPSSLTRRIELNEDFLVKVKKCSDHVLDFSYYSELECLEATAEGEIRRINVSKNKDLKVLILPSQELEGTLDLRHNSKLEKLNIAKNLLNSLKVHSDVYPNTRNWFGKDGKTPQSQKHNKEKIQFRDVIGVVNLGEEQENSRERKEIQSWKSLHKWLVKKIVSQEEIKIKIREEKKRNYPNLTENALNRFFNSLESTLDKNGNQYILFPGYDSNKTFEELFAFEKIWCGKKNEVKKIGEASYQELKKMFDEWRKETN